MDDVLVERMNTLKKQDWRNIKEKKHNTHLVIRWFHWSYRPRIYWCYWEPRMLEQRYAGLSNWKVIKGELK